MSDRFCKNCKHFSSPGLFAADADRFGTCSHPTLVSMISGQAHQILCNEMRSPWSGCQPAGLLFEPDITTVVAEVAHHRPAPPPDSHYDPSPLNVGVERKILAARLLAAVEGERGELDAFLEVTDEVELREAINELLRQRSRHGR